MKSHAQKIYKYKMARSYYTYHSVTCFFIQLYGVCICIFFKLFDCNKCTISYLFNYFLTQHSYEHTCNSRPYLFPQALLRYNCHITLYKFKVYTVFIWYTYYCKTITTVAIANTAIITTMSLSYVCVEPAQFFFGDNVTASCFSPKNMQ